MLWAADATGRLASVTTVHHDGARSGAGATRWRDGAEPQIVATVRTLLKSVLRSRIAESRNYRITQPGGLTASVKIEANPALSPDDGRFAGVIGSVHLVSDVNLAATVVDDDFARIVLLDAVADHVVAARALAARANDRRIAKMLNLVLLSIGDRMAAQADGGGD